MSTQPAPEEKFGIQGFATPEDVESTTATLTAQLNRTIDALGYEPTSDPVVAVLELMEDDDGVLRHEIRISRRAIKGTGN